MIGEIEKAIIAFIKDAQGKDKIGYNLKKVATYGGEFADGLRRVINDFPAVFIIFEGARRVKKTNSLTWWAATYTLVVCADNFRDEEAGRHGAAGKVGSYQLAIDMARLLGGQKLGMEIDAIEVTEIKALLNDKAENSLVSVYGLSINTGFTLQNGLVDPSDLASFKIFHARWDFPPHGPRPETLPADATADATDDVILEQD